MTGADRYQALLEEREAELADAERRLKLAPTEKAAKFLRNKVSRLKAEIDAINRTIASQSPKGAA